MAGWSNWMAILSQSRELGRMKTNIRQNIAVLASLSLLLSCAPVIHMTNGPMVPAADGQVTVDVGPNDNTRLNIRVEHLAIPGKVDPGSTVYMVWVIANGMGSMPQSIGALKVDENLTGTLSTLTPLKQFELVVTAEPTATSDLMRGARVLTAMISRT